MRYLRMLSNSAFAGLLAAVYIAWLLLHLNPSVPLTPSAAGELLTATVLSYGLHIFVVSYALYVLRQIVLTEPSTPGWISLRLLTWSAAALSGAAAVITWLHASGLRTALDPRAEPGLTRAAAVFAGATALFLLLAIAQLVARRRGRATVAMLFTLVTTASIVTPLMVRTRVSPSRPADDAPSPPQPASAVGPRVVFIALDGASLDVISPAVAAGRLPNFGRLLDRGASMHLATTRPTQAEPAWASVMTGKWPARHGVRGAALYRVYRSDIRLEVLPDYLFSQALVRYGLLTEEPHTSASLRAKPLWRLLDGYGISSGVIGLPLTYPVGPARGFIVSDRVHRREGREAAIPSGLDVWPAPLELLVTGALASEPPPPPALQTRLDLMPPGAERESLLRADRVHREIAARLVDAGAVRLLAVRYPGLDAIGHYYLRYGRPDAFGDVPEDDRRAYGRVFDDYYAYVDSLVGEALGALRGDDLLVVVSAFGMEPLPLGKRLLERVAGDPRFTGTHERAPDGFLMAYGATVAAGQRPRGAVVDVVPTVLYFLGLPVARDMDGSPATDVFTRAFNAQRTITSIPTYEP